jgi:hypothetical protein
MSDLDQYLQAGSDDAASILGGAAQETNSPAGSDDWFEQAASDFLSATNNDPVFEDILEATRGFTRKNFAMRAGLLYRQQLQNTPSYEVVCELEDDLVRLSGVANGLAANAPQMDNPHKLGTFKYGALDAQQAGWKADKSKHTSEIVAWAIEVLAPKLTNTSVVKVTKSTKKAKGAILLVPDASMTALSLEYKVLLEEHINPRTLLPKLVVGDGWVAVRRQLAKVGGHSITDLSLLNALWSKKEQNQWAYGLVEYANALIGLVAYAAGRDPMLKPRKYLCYFQKKSEATLYRGQEELDAMIANMQADNLLARPPAKPGTRPPTVIIDDPQPDPQFAMLAQGEDNEQPAPEEQANPSTGVQSLREKLQAKRLAKQER